jgi:hypothetical protein
MTSAYEMPELKKLERTFTYRRGENAGLTVQDGVSFVEPQRFETALITWSDWVETAENELTLKDSKGAVRVKIDTGGEPFNISAQQIDEDVTTPKKPTHLAVALVNSVKTATVKLTITPAK